MTATVARRKVRIGGILPVRQERPKLLAHMLQLYKGDLLFRSLVDLSVIGMVVVGAKTDWSSWAAAWQRAMAGASQPSGYVTQLREPRATGPGQATIDAIGDARIDRDAVRLAGAQVASALTPVAEAVDAGAIDKAWQLVSVLDDRDATIAYAKAVVLLHRPGFDQLAAARLLLRRSTERAVYPAYVLAGEVLTKLLLLDESGQLPAAARVSVDDTGGTRPATRAELAAEAASWWERAASFGRTQGLRLFALARARGYAGKADLLGAAALWKQAADAGDAISQFELAELLTTGRGVQQDTGEAIRLYRLAAEALPTARLKLAVALSSKSVAGDEAAAREAIQQIERYIELEKDFELRGGGQYLLGQLLFQMAPTGLRDPSRALLAFEQSTRNGMREAAFVAGKIYSAGTAGKRDPTCAYAFFIKARAANPKEIESLMSKLEAEIGPVGLQRANRISFDLSRAGGNSEGGSTLVQSYPSRKAVQPALSADVRTVCERIG